MPAALKRMAPLVHKWLLLMCVYLNLDYSMVMRNWICVFFVYIFVDRSMIYFTLSTNNKHIHMMKHSVCAFEITQILKAVYKISWRTAR
jgi:hypothetical protein